MSSGNNRLARFPRTMAHITGATSNLPTGSTLRGAVEELFYGEVSDVAMVIAPPAMAISASSGNEATMAMTIGTPVMALFAIESFPPDINTYIPPITMALTAYIALPPADVAMTIASHSMAASASESIPSAVAMTIATPEIEISANHEAFAHTADVAMLAAGPTMAGELVNAQPIDADIGMNVPAPSMSISASHAINSVTADVAMAIRLTFSSVAQVGSVESVVLALTTSVVNGLRLETQPLGNLYLETEAAGVRLSTRVNQ